MTASISSLVGGSAGRAGGGFGGRTEMVAEEGLEEDWTIF